MDYRRPLFQLEQWSPLLAKKMWGLTSLFENPLALALGFKVHHLDDLGVEIEIPLTRMNKNESGQMKSGVLLSAGEMASKILWHRHLAPKTEELTLVSVHCRFLKAATSPVKARAGLVEAEREKLLRKIRGGEACEHEIPIIFTDDRDQQIASMNCVWQLKSQVKHKEPGLLVESQSL